MDIAIKKIFAQILFWVYDFLDLLGDIFRVFAGLDPISVSNEGSSSDMTLLEAFMQHTIASRILFGLMLVGIIIAMVCGGVRTVKNVVKVKAGGEPHSHSATIGQTFYAILATVGCVFFVLMFVGFSNTLLKCVDKVTSVDGNTRLSATLFDLSVEWTYTLDYDNPVEDYVIKMDEYGNPVVKTDADGNIVYKTDNAGNYVDKDNQPLAPNAPESERVPVYEMTYTYYYPYSSELSSGYWEKENGVYYTAEDVRFNHGVDYVFGVHGRLWGYEYDQYAYTREPIVRLESFNIFTAYLVAIVVLVSIIITCLSLGKRVYDIVVLIFMMPLVCGTIPLDDGARFKAWRETLMSKVLLVFGAVLAMNVFFQATPIISMIDFSAISSNGLVQNIVKMFIYMCGALCVNTSQTLVARVLGTSADESRELMQAMAPVMSAVRFGHGAVKMVGNATRNGVNTLAGVGINAATGNIPGAIMTAVNGVTGGMVQGAGALASTVGAAGRFVSSGGVSKNSATVQSALSGRSIGNSSSGQNIQPAAAPNMGTASAAALSGQTGTLKSSSGLKIGTLVSKPYRDNTKRK